MLYFITFSRLPRTDEMVTPYTMGFLRDNNDRVHNVAIQDNWCGVDLQRHVSVAYDRKNPLLWAGPTYPSIFFEENEYIQDCVADRSRMYDIYVLLHNSHRLEWYSRVFHTLGRSDHQLFGRLQLDIQLAL